MANNVRQLPGNITRSAIVGLWKIAAITGRPGVQAVGRAGGRGRSPGGRGRSWAVVGGRAVGQPVGHVGVSSAGRA